MFLTILFITLTQAYIGGNTTCNIGEYLDDDGQCLLCESGYFCPLYIAHFECPENTFSFDGEILCRECGCKDNKCQKGNEINYQTKQIKFAGSCEGDEPCKPNYGYIPITKQCIQCPPGMISSGGRSSCTPQKENVYTTTMPIQNLTNNYILY